MASDSSAPDTWQRIWTLFHEALEHPAGERSAFVRAHCADPEIRREVEELLAAHASEGGPLDRSPLASGERTEVLAAATVLDVGAVLAGRFEVLALLGSGGMGAVYEALDRELGIRVALKALRPEIAADSQALARFRQEIALARQITHPNVCRVFDLFQHPGESGEPLYFVTMELLEGETLAERLRRDGAIPPDLLLPIVEQVAAGLEAAHRVGVVHRDLKPGNVMLTASGEAGELRAVVADFGLAMTLVPDDGSRLTRVGQVLGTPAYMAPEQLTGGAVTAATDIYAFGLMIYEALTGELPFSTGSPFSGALRRLTTPPPSLRSKIPQVPRRWERTVGRCLRRDPAERGSSVAEVVAGLRDEASRTRPVGRARLLLTVATVLLAAAIAVGWRLGWSGHGQPSAATEVAGEAEPARPISVLVEKFDNRTGEEILDGVLESALRREFSNSRLVNAVSRQRVADTLRLMKKPGDTEVDAALGREVALRDGEIDALLAGTAEKLGSTYLLSVEVIEPEQGTTVASLEEEAVGQDEVLPAVRRLGSDIRRVLGEAQESIAASEEQLARVTTPSLRALQLYTKGQSLTFVRDNRAAEELFRQAVAEDPDFASAYMALAGAIQIQGRPESEYMPFAEKAMALADSTPPSERYGIRAWYFLMVGRPEEAISALRAKAELEPERTASGLMAVYAFELGRYEDAVPDAVAGARDNPNSWFSNFQAARALTIWANRPREAAPYAARATELLRIGGSDELTPIASWFASWAHAFPAHLLWLDGDVEGVARLADSWYEELRSDPNSALGGAWPGFVALIDAGIGRLRRVEEIDRLTGTDDGYLLAKLRGESDVVKTLLEREADRPLTQDQSGGRGAALAIDLARHGLVERARSVTEELAARQTSHRSYGAGRRPTPAMVAAARGEVALAEGKVSAASRLLEEAVRGLRASGLEAYFEVAESLASVLEGEGDRARAIEVLEEASDQRGRLHGWPKLPWMRDRLLLARLYRRDGRAGEADKVEQELRALLALADSDHVVLRELNESPPSS